MCVWDSPVRQDRVGAVINQRCRRLIPGPRCWVRLNATSSFKFVCGHSDSHENLWRMLWKNNFPLSLSLKSSTSSQKHILEGHKRFTNSTSNQSITQSLLFCPLSSMPWYFYSVTSQHRLTDCFSGWTESKRVTWHKATDKAAWTVYSRQRFFWWGLYYWEITQWGKYSECLQQLNILICFWYNEFLMIPCVIFNVSVFQNAENY